MKDIRRQVLVHLRSGKKVILATVIRRSGSAPQVPGSSALFDQNGLVVGTVGGGLMESEVEQIARKAFQSGISDHHYFDLDEGGPDGAICGGNAVVLVDAGLAGHLPVFEEMENDLLEKKEGCLLTVVSRNNQSGKRIQRRWITAESGEPELPGLPPVAFSFIQEEIHHPSFGGFREIAIPDRKLQDEVIAYLEPMRNMPRLVIAGAGHVGKAVAHLGKLLHFNVIVIDDRPEFANRENVPDADQLVVNDFSPALKAIQPDPDTYIVIVTRGHGHDAEVLKACIGSDAAYIGMIGSSRKVAHMENHFLSEGWASREQWDRIHTPIGLEIHSKTVQEIAISIAAQLVMVRNAKETPAGSGAVGTKHHTDD